MGTIAINRPDLDIVALMNPADGYMGVQQSLEPTTFANLGPFSAVWLTAW